MKASYRAPYRSTLRRDQLKLTRDRILDATIAVLAAGVAELSIPAVARKARVSVPTVYRHFASKKALLAAVGDHVGRQSGLAELPPPADPEALAASAHELFRRLAALGPATRAAMASRLGARMRRESLMGRRRELVEAALGAAGGRQPWLVDVVLVLWSSASLHAFEDYLGLDAGQAADRVAWAIRTLVGGAR